MSEVSKPHISPEIEEAHANLWEVIHEITDPTVYDQANVDLDIIYSALLGSVEQYEELKRDLADTETERDDFEASQRSLLEQYEDVRDKWLMRGDEYDRLREQYDMRVRERDAHFERANAAEQRERRLEEQLETLRKTAWGLFQMIDRETWRATGGDDQQGHYEGDYRAAQIEEYLVGLASNPASRRSYRPEAVTEWPYPTEEQP